MPLTSNKVGLLGYGRFGQLLAQILAKEHTVLVYDPQLTREEENNLSIQIATNISAVLTLETVFIAVPIHCFQALISDIAPHLKAATTVIDVCSVKCYPVKIMKEKLPPNIGIIATHPIFGPDSINQTTYPLQIMMHVVRDRHNKYHYWKNFFSHQKMTILELSPEEHDKQAAYSQGITHFIGRALKPIIQNTNSINTLSYQHLLTVVQQTCNDTFELFRDMECYNPYSKKIIGEFVATCNQIAAQLDSKKPHS